MIKIKLERVHYMPKLLKPGILYISEEFGTAAHLCACGCGVKIRTPLGPTEWSIKDTDAGPTLWPSVGNWQQACKSHYVIYRGEVKWAGTWTDTQIHAGRVREERRREAYYRALYNGSGGRLNKFAKWIKRFFET